LNSHTDERVLVIPSIFAGEVRKGFCTLEDSRKLAAELIKSDQLRFMPRSQVEDDPEFLQLIPYVILHRYEPSQWFGDKFQVFNYRRGSAGGESRLIGKRSIGIGGHVNNSDGITPRDAFRGGVWREIDEEVYCSFDPVGSLIGTIYDDTDAVGRVHLGVVINFRLVGHVIVPKDKSLIEPRIYSLDTLVEESADFENWSRLVINNIPSARHDSPTPFGYCQPFVLDPLYGSRIITTN
jgi:predicted NUDIX family phosphoesterase